MKNIIVLIVTGWATIACSDCKETGIRLTVNSSTGSADDIQVDQDGVGVLPVTPSEFCEAKEFGADLDPSTCLLVPACESENSKLICLIPFESEEDQVKVTLSREGSDPKTLSLEPSPNPPLQYSSCDEATAVATVEY